MTTITTGTTGPKAWKIALVAAAVGLATLVVVTLPLNSSDTSGEPVAETATATLPESISGFEYENESTPARVVSPGVTTQYFGDRGEVFPEENGPMIRTAPAGSTQEYVGGPWTSDIPRSPGIEGATRVDPGAAASVGLNPGAIDEIVGGTTRAVPAPDNFEARWLGFAESQAATQTTQAGDVQSSYTASDDALVWGVSSADAQEAWIKTLKTDAMAGRDAGEPDPTAAVNARWQALADAYEDGTISSYYLPPATGEEPHVPAANNQVR